MQYLLLIYSAELPPDAAPDAAAMESQHAAYAAFTRETHDRKLFVAGEALEPTAMATSVRVRDGKATVTDGPFAETKEALGGFYLLDCRDLDEAIEIASKVPAAEYGTIEIRPIWVLPAEYAMAGGGQG